MATNTSRGDSRLNLELMGGKAKHLLLLGPRGRQGQASVAARTHAAAKALGLEVPNATLLRTDEVIE